MEITVVGGGLAGVEAAYQIARIGGKAVLYEMRPAVTTPAHTSGSSRRTRLQQFAEIDGPLERPRAPQGRAAASRFDRDRDCPEMPRSPGAKPLSSTGNNSPPGLRKRSRINPRIRVVRQEVTSIPDGTVMIASGPLTSDPLANAIKGLTNAGNLFFFDAISPIVDAESIDPQTSFYASRYSPDETGDYLNCPLSHDEYDWFYEALISAERVELKSFENTSYFEGCLPIEVLAERGKKTLAFGPMKPVGLSDPRTGKRPYAVVQLRKENARGTCSIWWVFRPK